MKTLKKLIPNVLLLLIVVSGTNAQNYLLVKDKRIEEIKLLESTDKDLERIFGKSFDTIIPVIKLKSGIIFIQYSLGKCDETDSSSWNVPFKVIEGIGFRPTKEIKLQTLDLDISKYKVQQGIGHTPQLWSYSNDELGIKYIVDSNEDKNGKVAGIIDEIEYYPSTKFSHLKCP